MLKSGCNIEKLQLEKRERLESAVALYMIIAWRILYIRTLSRLYPEAKGNLIFSDVECQALCLIVKKTFPSQQAPPLGELVKMLASLGGYLNRKHDGLPGAKTLWIGLQRLRDFTLAFSALKSSMVT